MEPMNLGSPVGSPGSPPTSPYLPSFLMGDPLSGVALNPKSPVRLGRHVSFSGSPTVSPQAGNVTPPRAPRGSVRDATWRATEKPNGPPTRGLYDYSIEPASVYSPQDSSFLSANQSNLSMQQQQASSTTPAADPSVSNWVTVFGFPPASASVILAQFSHYGNIVDTRTCRQGNWVHVRYQTRAEARRALSHNAKVFGNSIMVGVVPCTDAEIMSEAQQLGKENLNEVSMLSMMGHPSTSMSSNRSTNLGQSYASPLNATYTSPGNTSYGNMSYGNTSYGTPSRNVRPLGQAYRNAQYASEVQMARTTPQKSTSIVSKAWEMLGF